MTKHSYLQPYVGFYKKKKKKYLCIQITMQYGNTVILLPKSQPL